MSSYNMNTKNVLAIVIALVVAGGIYGGYKYLITPPVTPVSIGSSDAGSTFGNAKQAAIAVNLASPGTNGTTTFITNNDTNDRFVSSVELGCENIGTSQTPYTGANGAGVSTLQMTVGTGTASTIVGGIPQSFSKVVTAMVIPTSTANYLVSSSTSANNLASTTLSTIWHSGESMIFGINATNTAQCTIGVRYIQG